MELHEFPRPPQDNGRGVHWSLSVYEWGKRDWSFWAEQLQAMKIKWVKVMDDGGGSALPLVRRLADLEIMPVVRLYWEEQNPGNIGQRGRDAVRRFVQAGAVYCETNNEPDLDLEWKDRRRPPNWLDIVVDNFIIDADIILGEGGHLAVPAFGVGTLRDPFSKIVERGRRDILDGGAWAAIHNYCLARPLEYPNDPVNMYGEPITEEEWHAAGGRWAWEIGWEEVNRARKAAANPNANIMADATCFRGFEQLNAYIVHALGHPIPIMMTEGGYNVAQRAGTTAGDDPRYPKPTPQAASEMNLKMFQYMQGDREVLGKKVPDYFFAAMPWLIAAQRIGVQAPPAENQGPWFTHKYDQEWGLNGELPLVQMLKDLPSRLRQDGPIPQQWHKPLTPDKLARNWDFRLNYLGAGVKLEPATGPQGVTAAIGPQGTAAGSPYWKLVEATWLDKEEARGANYIFVKALDADDNPLENAAFVVARPDAQDIVTTKGSVDGFWGNYAMYGLLGTYSVEMAQGGYPSDRVTGVGLGTEEVPDAWTSTAFRFTFQLVEKGSGGAAATEAAAAVTGTSTAEAVSGAAETVTDEAPPVRDGAPPARDEAQPEVPAPPPTAAPPGPEQVETVQPSIPTEAERTAALRRALLEAAKPHIIPLNPDAALYQYARQHRLGERLSDEFTFEHEAVKYVAQVFKRGIVYAPVGQWRQVTHFRP
jgi:hypothetical protein